MGRLENLVGAWALGLADAITVAGAEASGAGGAGSAALATLLADPGIGMDHLARTVGISGSGAVRLVDRLQDAGLVRRGAGVNGRSVSLTLTATGQRQAEDVLARRDRELADTLTALTEQERSTLELLLEKLLGGFTHDRTVGDHLCRLCDVRVCPAETCPVERALP